MQMHQLQRKTKLKEGKYVGRGGKRGKTAGRGTKGQKARAGRKLRPELRDIIKKLPKQRGRGKNSNKGFQPAYVPVKLSVIEKRFNAGDTVSPSTLLEKGIIAKEGGMNPRVKLLAVGTLTKKIEVKGCGVSNATRIAIEKVGGSIK